MKQRADFPFWNNSLQVGCAFATTILVPFSVFGQLSNEKKVQKPNILFIFSDDHALNAISAYNDKNGLTPNIDRIARAGVVFDNNFCANSISSPSRACLLTGKHSHMNGVTTWQSFDGSQETFPKILQRNGYATAIFGKWHLTSKPTGFEEWAILEGQGNYYNPNYITPTGVKRIEGYSEDITTDMTLDFIKRQKDSGRPFLAMCHFKAPHRTWFPNIKYLNSYKDMVYPEPSNFWDNYQNRATPASKNKMSIDKDMQMGYDLKFPLTENNEWSRMTPEQQKAVATCYEARNKAFQDAHLQGKDLVRWKLQEYMRDYMRCVASVDENVGRLLDYLKENHLDENTIIVYSADQGFYLGEHGWFDKRWMYEESFRMPLIMAYPKVIKPKTHLKQLTQNIDFAPAFLDLAGIQVPVEMQGISFAPLFKHPKRELRDALYYHYYDGPGEHGVAKHYGIRTRQYKLIYYYEYNEWELFDLKKDPNEMRSVYNEPEYANIQARLFKRLFELKAGYKNTVGMPKS